MKAITFKFTAVLQLTITSEEANYILNGPKPEAEISDWIEKRYGITKNGGSSYEVEKLQTAYAKALLESRLNEAKQIELKP